MIAERRGAGAGVRGRGLRQAWRRGLLGLLVAVIVVACAPTGAPILANPTIPRRTSPPASAAPSRPADPIPVVLPGDDKPHARLTEWWYYTGHLGDDRGGKWGFEYVIFRAERGGFPVSWASHLALTDERAQTFTYDQRSEIGPQVDQSDRVPGGFGLAITGFDPSAGASSPAGVSSPAGASSPVPGATGTTGSPWLMGGVNGRDRLVADSSTGVFGLALDLAATRPPVLHDQDGWVDFGPAGGSYYYSRTRMAATGSLRTARGTATVQGLAWFDHQWGDFIAVGGGGWDWFAVNLDDGTDLTLSLVRAADGSNPLVYGTLVDPAGVAHHLSREAFTVTSAGTWTSPRTGATYPASWRIEVPSERLVIQLRPVVAEQELDTRASTGVVYWEGSQVVQAQRAGRALGGEAYVELTGYDVAAPSGAPGPTPSSPGALPRP